MERLLLGLARLAVWIYYRVERLGGEVPAEGPVLLVANHPNGLVDPVVLAGVTPRRVRFLGKAPLFALPVLGRVMRGLRVLPVYRPQDGADPARNEDTFQAVFAALRAGDLVCLFPEGESHSDPALHHLKTGAARMALGAEAECGFSLGVRIVPVGLVYRSKRHFQSAVAAWVGTPVDARAFAREHAADEREAVRALTARIDAALREVTLDLDDWKDLPLLELAERIWREGDEPPVARLKRFADGLRLLRARDPRRIEELGFRIARFRDRLRRLGLAVDDLEVRYTPAVVLRYTARTLADLVGRLPLALAGGAFWYVPYRLSGRLGVRFAPSEDTTATTILLAACLLFPGWLALGVAVSWLLADGACALAAAIVLPLTGPFAAGFPAWWRAVAGDVSAFLRLGHRRRLRALLRRQRAVLAGQIEALAAEVRAVRTVPERT